VNGWLVPNKHGVTEVNVGDRFRFDHDPPGELWEVAAGPVDEIESDYGDGSCPIFPCRQVSGDPTKYPADRKETGFIDMCGDLVAAAIEESRP
jgi:hypothetical protein